MAGTLEETITGSVTGVPGGALSITLTSTVTLSAARNSSHGYIDATSDSYKSKLECVSPSITYHNGIVGSSKSLTKPSVAFSGTFPTTAGTYVKVIQVGLGDTTSVISKSYVEFRLTITVKSLEYITIKCSATNGSASLSSVSVPEGSVVSKSTAASGIHTVSFTYSNTSYGTVTFTPNAGYEFSSAAVGSNFSPQNGGQFLGDSTYTVTFTKKTYSTTVYLGSWDRYTVSGSSISSSNTTYTSSQSISHYYNDKITVKWSKDNVTSYPNNATELIQSWTVSSTTATLTSSTSISAPSLPTPSSSTYYRYYIKYDKNGGGGTAPGATTEYNYYSYAGNVRVSQFPDGSTMTAPVTGSSFVGWSQSATATTGISQITVQRGTEYTLYAVWERIRYYSVLNYNANGGSGAPSSDASTIDSLSTPASRSVTVSDTQPTNGNKFFMGWSTSPTGSVNYYPGSTISVPYSTSSTGTTLYAVWASSESYLIKFSLTNAVCSPSYDDNKYYIPYGSTVTSSIGSGNLVYVNVTYNSKVSKTIAVIRPDSGYGFSETTLGTVTNYGTYTLKFVATSCIVSFNSVNANPSAASISVPYEAVYKITDGEIPSITFSGIGYQNTVSFTPDTGYTFLNSRGIGYVDPDSTTGALVYTSSGTVTADMEFEATPNAMHKIGLNFIGVSCSEYSEKITYVPDGSKYAVDNTTKTITFTYNGAVFSKYTYTIDPGYVFYRVGIVTVNDDVDYEDDGTYSGNTDDIDDIIIEAVRYYTVTINTEGCTVDKSTLSVEEYTDFTTSGNTAEFSYDSKRTTVTVTPLAGYENPVWSPSSLSNITSDQTISVECSKINYKATVYLSESDDIEQYAKVTVTRNNTSTDYTKNSEIIFNVDDKISAVWYANTIESTDEYVKTYTTYNRCAEIHLTGWDSERNVASYGSTVTMPAFTGSYSVSIRPYSSAIVTSVKKYYRAYIKFSSNGGSGSLPGVYDYGYSSGSGYTKWFEKESDISTSPDTWLAAEDTPWTKDLLNKENYHLIGWYLDSDDDVIPLDTDTIYVNSKGVHTLTAVWEGDPVEHTFTSSIDNALVVGVSPVHSLILEMGYTYQSQKKTEEHLSVPRSLTADYGTIVSFEADATSEGGNYYPIYKKVTVSRIKGILSLGGESKTYDTPLYDSGTEPDSYNALSFTVDKEFTQIELCVTAYTFKIIYNAGDRDISYTDTATYYQGVYATLPTLESIYSASQDTAFYSTDVRKFKGWALSQADANSKTVTYTDGQSEVYFSTYTSENTPTDNDTLTLYAVWEYHSAVICITPKPSDRCSKAINISGMFNAKLPSSVIWPLVILQESMSRGSPSEITRNITSGGKNEIDVVSDTPYVKITPAGLSDYYVNYTRYKAVGFIGHESSISKNIYFSTADDKGNHSATVEYIPKTVRDDCILSFEAFGYTLVLHRNKEASDNDNTEDTTSYSTQYWQALECELPLYSDIVDFDSDWSYGDRKFLGWATSKDAIVPDSKYMDGATVCYSQLDDDATATLSDTAELNLYAVWSAGVLICIVPDPDDSSKNYWVQTSAGSMQIKYIFDEGADPRNSDGSINTDKRRDLNGEPLETPTSSDLSMRFEGWKCISWGSDTLKSTPELMAYQFVGNKSTEYYVYASFTDKVYYPISFVDKDGYAYHFRDNTDQSFDLTTTRTVDKVNSVTGALIEEDTSFTPDPKNRNWQSDQSNATITATIVDVPRTGVTYYEDDYPSGTPDEVTLAIRCPGESVLHLGTIQSVSNSYSASLTTLPVLPYGYSGTFCMDLGVQRSISVSTVRVTPANSDDMSADSRHWSNRKWLRTLKNLSDRWQMNTNGISLWMYVPAEMTHNMPNLTTDKDNIAETTEGIWSRVNAYISSIPISYSAGDMHKLALTLTFRVGTIYPKPPTVEYSQISLVKDGVTKKVISVPMNSSYVVPGCDSTILPISEGLFEGWTYKFDGKTYQPGDILKTYYYNTDGVKTLIDGEDSKLSVKYTSLTKTGDDTQICYYDSFTDTDGNVTGKGTVTVPTGKTKVTICAVGGGGAGGYSTESADSRYSALLQYIYAGGGGGGSGYYMIRRVSLSDLGDDITTLYINVGKGGIVEGITSFNDMNGHATYVRADDENGRVLAIAYGGEYGGSGKTGGSGGKGYMAGGIGGYAYPTTDIASNPKPAYVNASPGSSVLDKGGKAGTKLSAIYTNQYFYCGGGGGGGEPPIFGGVDGYGGNGVTDGTGDSLKDGKNGGGGGGAQKASPYTTDGIPGKGGDGYVYLIWE